MRTKRSRPAGSPAPISASLRGRSRTAPPGEAATPDGGSGSGGAVRLVALLGIGLMAAALLLPSGEAPVVVPADTLQPASDLATTPDPSAADPVDSVSTDRGLTPATTAQSQASSAASVVGDDLARADGAQTKARRQRQKQPRAARQRPKSTAKRTPSRSSARPSPAPTPQAAPAPVAPTPAPAPARPAKPKPRGGPTAEFGGL